MGVTPCQGPVYRGFSRAKAVPGPCQGCAIEHRTSNIEHRTSNIEHRTSNIEHRTSNIEGGDMRPAQPSTFGVQCSVFDVSPSTYERFEIRIPPIAEKPRLHRRGRAHACARHRGKHVHLQRLEFSFPAATCTGKAR